MTNFDKTLEEGEKEFDSNFVNYFGSKDRQAIKSEFQENPQAIKHFLTTFAHKIREAVNEDNQYAQTNKNR